jgi:hypothetical protein
MSFLGFEQSGFVLDLRRYVSEYAKAEGRAMQHEVAKVEIYVYRAYGSSGPRSYDPDTGRISTSDSSFGDGWGVNVQHHNTTTAAALGRHVVFCSDAHLAEDRDVQLYATAQAICAFAAGRITHSHNQLSPDTQSAAAPRRVHR